MRRVKPEQARALCSAMERRQEQRRLLLRILAILAILTLLLVALATFLMRQHPSPTPASIVVGMAVSMHALLFTVDCH